MIEMLDRDIAGIELALEGRADELFGRVKEIGEAAVVIPVTVRGDHRIESDCLFAILGGELPVDEVGRRLARRVSASRIATIGQDVSAVRRDDQDSVPWPTSMK